MASIHLDNISVDILVFDASSRSLKNRVLEAATGGQIRPREGNGKLSVRAIDGLTLDLPHGSRLGLVGHNGAGKSTILRVIAGIYEPTGGSMRVEGDVAAMFDIGFGMDLDASGWENIILRGMLLGYTRKEIEARSEEIGALTGLGDFLDMPMRTYSAGMSTRLAFAVSTSITPEILLVDEGIGAGDAAFLEQARQRLNRFIGDAGILVMASHSEDLIKEWCDTGLWMEHGKMRGYGPIDEVLEAYTRSRD
ncbi:ABC transporter ATP-binding protein [Aureimonas fodinaquatilis]|uniref:ABC transporter ATP-binding protein n=1 Tax=Aureimonas fodinaquatilis TaxID=2565783 RepID=A0A5B0E159_9HYPH|nr:ABC transporter ATP-binding protein [Aureimonas fodinaquatilis]KAA0972042.1 ABC transporter ATP-binding protein [Aureimonas fodinaquatilis]